MKWIEMQKILGGLLLFYCFHEETFCILYFAQFRFTFTIFVHFWWESPIFLQGSPLRWAAKADEIGMTSSVTSACSPLKDSECTMEQISSHQQKQQRSCSANQLDAIGNVQL